MLNVDEVAFSECLRDLLEREVLQDDLNECPNLPGLTNLATSNNAGFVSTFPDGSSFLVLVTQLTEGDDE